MTDEEAAKNVLVALKYWVENHMDQWERWQFTTKYGQVFVHISYYSEPGAEADYDEIDKV